MNNLFELPCNTANLLHEAAAHIDNKAIDEAMPFAIYKPKLFKDGDQWCALLGDNIEEGVCGLGNSPDKAAKAFNAAWHAELS